MKYYPIYLSLLIFLSSNIGGQALTKDQIKFLQRNSKVICEDSTFSQPDWKSVTTNFKDKNIILLGEFNHGSKEVFLLRNSLIKYLHQERGIKAILFESGIGELISADIKKGEMTAVQITNGLFAGWRTDEFTELMSYIKSENISIAGFDVQRTGGSFALLLKETADKKNIDSTLSYDLEVRYGLLNRELTNREVIYDSVKLKTENLIADYQIMHDELFKYKAQDSTKELLFTLVTIKNRVTFLSYMLAFVRDKNWNKRWAARDSAMANNIQWLIENIYKNEPVIVIGHNFHIAKFNDKESVMGEILSTRYGKEMYSIGVFGGSGSFHNNSGKEEQMSQPDSAGLDIKHVISGLNGTVNFIDIPERKVAGDEWLDNALTVNDTFIDLSKSNKMVLSKYFDGLLLIDKVSPPKNNQ